MYYSVSDGILCSSPRLRSLAEQVAFPKELNEKALTSYFIYGYPIGPETFYKNILKVRPGHCLIWDIEEKRFLSDVRWFIPEFEADASLSEADWLSRLETVFNTVMREEREDIKKHPAACLLSSGVDSSYLLAASGVPRAVGIGYRDPCFSEAEEAEKTAASLGRDFSKIICSAEDFADEYRAYVRSVDQPIVNPTVPVIGSVCKKVSETTELLYSGEGADELFLGYYPFDLDAFLSFTKRPYYGFGQSASYEEIEKLMNADCGWIKNSVPEEIYRDTEKSGAFAAAMWTDIHLYYEGDTCAYISYIRNRAGLDVRLPFADPRLFDVTSKIPVGYLLHNADGTGGEPIISKYIFRKLASEILPDEVAFRPKRAFPAPIRLWLQTPALRTLFEKQLFSETADRFFRSDYLKMIWESYLSGNTCHWRTLYAVCTFLCWYEAAFDI